MPAQTKDRLHGTLDALILKTLSWGPRHGYAISRWLSDTSGEASHSPHPSIPSSVRTRTSNVSCVPSAAVVT